MRLSPPYSIVCAAKVAYVNLVMYCGAWFKSVRLRVHLSYVLYGFALASTFNLYHPMVLTGGRLGTSVMVYPKMQIQK